MQKYFALIAMIMLYFLNIPIVFAATEVTGTITAKRGDTVKVEFQPHKTAGPKVGDEVEFSTTLDGVLIKAGIGKVTEVNAKAVWVKVTKKNLKLTMNAIIYATGTPVNLVTVDNKFLDFKGKNKKGWGYCVFGKVVSGMEVVDAIALTNTTSVRKYRDVPIEPVVIRKAYIR